MYNSGAGKVIDGLAGLGLSRLVLLGLSQSLSLWSLQWCSWVSLPLNSLARRAPWVWLTQRPGRMLAFAFASKGESSHLRSYTLLTSGIFRSSAPAPLLGYFLPSPSGGGAGPSMAPSVSLWSRTYIVVLMPPALGHRSRNAPV